MTIKIKAQLTLSLILLTYIALFFMQNEHKPHMLKRIVKADFDYHDFYTLCCSNFLSFSNNLCYIASNPYRISGFDTVSATNYIQPESPTPLMQAIMTSQPTHIIDQMLENGANANEQDANGNTALMYTWFRDTDTRRLIMILLAHGADKSIKNNRGYSIYDLIKPYPVFDSPYDTFNDRLFIRYLEFYNASHFDEYGFISYPSPEELHKIFTSRASNIRIDTITILIILTGILFLLVFPHYRRSRQDLRLTFDGIITSLLIIFLCCFTLLTILFIYHSHGFFSYHDYSETMLNRLNWILIPSLFILILFHFIDFISLPDRTIKFLLD